MTEMSAVDRMNRALADLEQTLTPCRRNPERWLSEDDAEKADAAAMCMSCPVLAECSDLAGELKPTFGVWAGRDMSLKPRRRRAA